MSHKHSFLLFARHGWVDRDAFRPEREYGLSETGVAQTYETVKTFLDYNQLQSAGERIRIREILVSPYLHACQTAGIVGSVFESAGLHIPLEISEQLSPKELLKPGTLESLCSDLEGEVKSVANENPDIPNALMLVGHEPHLTLIAQRLLKREVPATSHSEILCARFHGSKGSNLWRISPHDAESAVEIREKIKSKMTVAGQLAAFLGLLMTIALGMLADQDRLDKLLRAPTVPPLLPTTWLVMALLPRFWGLPEFYRAVLMISMLSLFAALVLYFAAMFAYDGLLMPARFWSWRARLKTPEWLVRRPPSSTSWILYQNMVRTWDRLFKPATLAFLFALAGLAESVFHLDFLDYLVFVALAAVGATAYFKISWPVQGAED